LTAAAFSGSLLLAVACSAPTRDPSSPSDGVALWINGSQLPLVAEPVLGALVKLENFGEFRPSTPIEQAIEKFGRPSHMTTDHRGTFYHYEVGNQHVAVADLESSSFGVTWQDWSLYAYPEASAVTDVFRGPLLELLKQRLFVGELVLSVVCGGQDQRISAELRDSGVEELRWYIVDP
jgi:hypothetical protein